MRKVTADILRLEEISHSIGTYANFIRTLTIDGDIEGYMHAVSSSDYIIYREKAITKVDMIREFVKMLINHSDILNAYVKELDNDKDKG